MSRSCDLTGKIHQTGHNVSHSNIINKFKIKSSKKVIAIGDSFNHDILGAMKQGFDSLFIENGIHRDDIKDLNRKKWYLSQFKPKYCQFMLKF